MRALLDTHTFLWFNADDRRLSERALAVIGDGDNEIFLSAVSAWEIAIKFARLQFPESVEPGAYIPSRMEHYGLQPLPIAVRHALHVASLPAVHSDPFDRLLVAQSQIERLPIITSDPNLRRYQVEIIW